MSPTVLRETQGEIPWVYSPKVMFYYLKLFLIQWNVISGGLNLKLSFEYRFNTGTFLAEMVVRMLCMPLS